MAYEIFVDKLAADSPSVELPHSGFSPADNLRHENGHYKGIPTPDGLVFRPQQD